MQEQRTPPFRTYAHETTLGASRENEFRNQIAQTCQRQVYRKTLFSRTQLIGQQQRPSRRKRAGTLKNKYRNLVAAASGNVPRGPFGEKFPTTYPTLHHPPVTSFAKRRNRRRDDGDDDDGCPSYNTPLRSPTSPFYIHARHIRNV